MKSPVGFEGHEMQVKDLILFLTDPYIEHYEELSKGLFKLSDINNIYLGQRPSGELAIKYGIKDEETAFRLLEENLNLNCEQYFLKLPQGYIYKTTEKVQGVKFGQVEGLEEILKTGSSSVVVLPYKGKNILVELNVRNCK